MAHGPDRVRHGQPRPRDPTRAGRDIAAVIATGRCDFPNQINNVLAFPGIFRGALDAGATTITENMKVAAAERHRRRGRRRALRRRTSSSRRCSTPTRGRRGGRSACTPRRATGGPPAPRRSVSARPSRSSRRVDAVTFDFWDTLCRRQPGALEQRRAELVSVALADVGVVLEADVLDGAMTDVWDVYLEAWHANRQFSGDDAARWVASTLAEHRPELASPPVKAAIVDAFHSAANDADLLLVAGVAEVLGALAAGGIRLGIVCDVGFLDSSALRRDFERHGVLGHFHHWSFSDEVGAFKPDRRIFDHALAGLGGIDPARAAHVGDIRRTDVAGARAMGIAGDPVPWRLRRRLGRAPRGRRRHRRAPPTHRPAAVLMLAQAQAPGASEGPRP